jgi:H+/Cl- antiporter ClcA
MGTFVDDSGNRDDSGKAESRSAPPHTVAGHDAPRDWDDGLRQELTDWRIWAARALVVAMAVVAGLTVVGFTWLAESASGVFAALRARAWWSPLLWTPLCAAAVVWCTRRFAPGAAGSGIPQVMATLERRVGDGERGLFVSLRLSVAKILLTAGGLLGGLSLGREGPSVQIAAGIMLQAKRFMPKGMPAGAVVGVHGLLVAGGAAGIAAAFNTPLGGVMFAIEELARAPEQRSSGLIIAAIVLAGLVAVSAHGNGAYFGVIHAPALSLTLLWPGLLVAVVAGVAGGIFSRLLIASLSGQGQDRFSRFRARRPVLFAAGCGLAVAVIGVVTAGAAFGSGYGTTRAMVEGAGTMPAAYALFKFLATWLTTWSGVPAGIFAPSLAIGAALGNDVALLLYGAQVPALIALGMVGFLAAATQAPLTAFIIVMEMVDGHAMVLSLMACALVSCVVARAISPPLYPSLARMQLGRIPQPSASAEAPHDQPHLPAQKPPHEAATR